MADDVNSLFNKYPGRRKQIDLLQSIINDSKCDLKPNSFVIEGPPNTGKTAILIDVLRQKKQPYLLIDCYECYNPTLLYNSVLEELFGPREDYAAASVNSFYGFFSVYRKALKLCGKSDVQYIIFKHFDHLETSVLNDIKFLEAKFSNIWDFCSVFVVTNNKFFETSVHELLRIHFPRYTKEQLREVLTLKRAEHCVDVYNSFLQVFVPWIYEKERDLRDLLRLVDLLYPVYHKPIDDKIVSPTDHLSLYLKIKPHLEKYSDPISLLLFNRTNLESNEGRNDPIERFNQIELPFYSKYLLLSAYLASYIPPKEDGKLFCRRSLKKKKKKSKMASRSLDREVNRRTGPKPFPLNRLLAIYFSIVDKRSTISATLLSQVASLVELKLLVACRNDENIDYAYYKCVAKPNLVFSVAKNVKFDLEKFVLP